MAEKDDLMGLGDASKSIAKMRGDFKAMKSDADAIAKAMKSIGGVSIGGGSSSGFGNTQMGTGSDNILAGSQAQFSTPTPSFGGGPGASMGGGSQGTGLGGASFGSGNILGDALGKLPIIGGMLSNIGTIGSGISTAMPNVADTLQYAKGYYGASVMSGLGGGQRKMMEQATFSALSSRGGMTSAGADAAVASLLTSRGMQFSNDPNSTYMQTVNQSATMAKYLNMPVEQAAGAIEGLTSGKGASNLLRNYGIFASDTTTGKEKTMPEIFGELRSRLALGDTSQAGTMKSLRSGSLSAVLDQVNQAYGQATGDMFAQYMLDASGDGQQAMKWTTGQGLGGDNPMNAIYGLNASTTKQYGKAEDKYIQGIQDMAPVIQNLNDAFGDLAGTVGNVNSALQLLGGSNAGKGVGQVFEGVAGFLGNLPLGKLVGKLFGGGDSSSMGTGFAPTSNSGGGGGTGALPGSTGGGTSNNSNVSAAGVGATAGSSGSATQVFKLVRPVAGRVTLGYNVTDANHRNGHSGIDFACEIGTTVQACADGTVVTATKSNAPDGGYGNYMEIDHGNGFKTLYGHLSSYGASVGTVVKAGQAIARSGNTGHSTGPHLHLTLFKNGGITDPAPYLGGSVPVSGDMSTTSGDAQGAANYIGASDLVSTSISGVNTGSQSSGTSGPESISGGNYAVSAAQGTGGDSSMTSASVATASGTQVEASSIGVKGSGSGGAGANVTINVSVQKASEEEARRLAAMVKRFIKDDAHLAKMGRM